MRTTTTITIWLLYASVSIPIAVKVQWRLYLKSVRIMPETILLLLWGEERGRKMQIRFICPVHMADFWHITFSIYHIHKMDQQTGNPKTKNITLYHYIHLCVARGRVHACVCVPNSSHVECHFHCYFVILDLHLDYTGWPLSFQIHSILSFSSKNILRETKMDVFSHLISFIFYRLSLYL